MHAGASGQPPTATAGPTSFALRPFRGLALSAQRVGDPASARAFARPYRDVAARLERWEAQGHVVRDREAALYLHEYTVGALTVRGLVGALDVSRAGAAERVVLPHEGVHQDQAADLAARMGEMELNPAPILLVHRGPGAVRDLIGRIMTDSPWQEYVDRAERHNRVWAVRDGSLLTELAEHLASSRPLIADGHHRYAAYVALHEQRPGTAADLGLAMLVDQDDTPLHLGAIHRTISRTDLDDLARAVGPAGTLTATTEASALAALSPTTLAVTDGAAWARLDLGALTERAAVQVLHEDVLPRLQGPHVVGYHHSVDDALERVARGQQLAVLMPAPDFDLVDRIVSSHRLLPEKATSFQPKPSLGVLMRSLLDG
ncbi:DUF1015 domain-containing protein [Nocardioides aestuarii]|uniref:DUF1015 family protein n=1 Tax=Nocardioides aestuarii TaxID=252231 RepID=A0ABW4TPR1_9ACTN